MLGGTYLMPRRGEVQDSSISMDLPTGMNPSGWHGTRRQESEQERGILAPDTEFSKADYVQELPISLDATETIRSQSFWTTCIITYLSATAT